MANYLKSHAIKRNSLTVLKTGRVPVTYISKPSYKIPNIFTQPLFYLIGHNFYE